MFHSLTLYNIVSLIPILFSYAPASSFLHKANSYGTSNYLWQEFIYLFT